jgi:hypothetical protein
VIPAHKHLRAYLAEFPKDALLFLVDQTGRPLDETSFSKDFRAALDAAALRRLHFHGLRHAAGAALAEAGCSEKEIMAVLGHKTLSMMQKYTQGARRRRLAPSAIAKLAGSGSEWESGKLRRICRCLIVGFLVEGQSGSCGGCSRTRTCDPLIKSYNSKTLRNFNCGAGFSVVDLENRIRSELYHDFLTLPFISWSILAFPAALVHD